MLAYEISWTGSQINVDQHARKSDDTESALLEFLGISKLLDISRIITVSTHYSTRMFCFFFLGRLRLVSPSQILLMLQNSMKMHGARRRPGPIMHPMHVIYYIWVVVSNMFYFYPYLGKIPILTNIFQMGWNHQLDIHSWLHQRNVENTQGRGALAPTSLQFWGLPEREKKP